MALYDGNEVKKVLDELTENGVNISQLGAEIGLCRSTLRTAKSLGRQIRQIDDLARLLKNKAKVLTQYDPSKHSLSYVCQEAAIKQSHLAKEIGISKQGLHQLQYRLSPERKTQLRVVFQALSRKVNQLALQLEKISK